MLSGRASELTTGQGPSPTQSAFLPPTDILQISTPRPRAPTKGMAGCLWTAEARKRVQLFRDLFAKISFQKRKCAAPGTIPAPNP